MRSATLGSVVILCSVSAAQADTVADCNQVRDPQLRLRACSQIIAASNELLVSLGTDGDAYRSYIKHANTVGTKAAVALQEKYEAIP